MPGLAQYGSSLIDVNFTTEVLGTLGFYICGIGLLSYSLKERLFVSDALLSICVGIAVGPLGLNWISPFSWAANDEKTAHEIVFQVCRIVLGIQVLFTGINLPKAYLKKKWRSLALLLLPIMTMAWFISALIIWGIAPGLTFLEALAIAACVTPTDPVLSASVVKGRFAEKYVSKRLRDLIAAESGANDGFGFPFLYLALFLVVKRNENHSLGWAIGNWVLQCLLYQVLLSCAIGALIGYIARKSLKYAATHKWIDHESFLAYGIGLSFFTLGVVGVIGSDDILACFVAGNSFTWDDYFRVETEDHAFQDVIDVLLDSAVFIFIGTLIPWSDMTSSGTGLLSWQAVVISLLILLLRRLPAVLALYRWIPDVATWKEAVFLGHFGPIGVGAVYYLYLALHSLPAERVQTIAIIQPLIYIIVLSSVVVHGITIPIFKLGPTLYQRTKSMSRTNTTASTRISAPSTPIESVTLESNRGVPNGNVQFGNLQ